MEAKETSVSDRGGSVSKRVGDRCRGVPLCFAVAASAVFLSVSACAPVPESATDSATDSATILAPAAKTPPAASAAAPHPESEARAAPDQATGGAVPSALEAPPARHAKEPARAARHMVAAANPLATEAGRDILRAGGGAVDAAIAAQMVLNLVEPQSSGIGGGGFMLHYAAAGGEIAAYDGREKAPRAAHPYMFLDGSGKPRDFFDAAVGGLSVGIPGLLRMLELAHREHGRLSWKRLFEPAISLAEKGFEISPRLHKLLAGDKYLKRFAAPAGYFYEPDGSAKPVGARLVNRPLARTFRMIAESGADAFYSGPFAEAIVDTVRGVAGNPGVMTAADLAVYEAKKRDAVCLPYREWLVCGMPPPSSGGITTLQILGLLQGFDLGTLEAGSSSAVHLIAEASRLAFADRDTYIADPDFVPVPTAGMLDPGYLELRARGISEFRGMEEAQPGMPGVGARLRLAPGTAEHGVSTTHLSVLDADGNAVAMTSSIEDAFGARLMVNGFLLNNQLTDFSFLPNRDAAPIANRVESGKRPRSSMAPVLVFDASGRVVLVIGSPGGSRIIGYVVKTLVGVLDWKLDIQAAIDLPNFVNRNGATELEKGTPILAIAADLEALGHAVEERDMNSGLHGIAASQGAITGGADRRREGVALGD